MKAFKNISKIISTIISYSCLIILIIIGLIFTVYIVDVKIQQSKGGIPKPLFGAYVIISGSMEPNIHVYDVIVSKRTDTTELKEGDVITFYSNDSRFYGVTVTHRIVEVIDAEKGIFRTRGDANNVEDDALTIGENIIGKVVMRIPQLGRLQFFLASKGGWLIVVLIPCLAIISYDIVKIAKLTSKKASTKKQLKTNSNKTKNK
ncbi:MAG: signal peptidase I [Firmicutes bacterium]|nr:signal peptidase I [Bacillota bacterium]